jgi:hypothetical protein
MLAAALGLLLARPARPDPGDPPVEPPVEAPEGVDYESERADSIEAGIAETGFGATGRAGARPRARRRVRFSDGGFAGEAREGADDPLAGGRVEARTPRGRWTAGRLKPVWGCGLALGGAAEPWRFPAPEARARPRVATTGGDGIRWQSGARAGGDTSGAANLEALGGRFAGHDVAGARAGVAGVSLGALTSPAGRGPDRWRRAQTCTSLGLDRPDLALELALDGRGRWSAEAGIERDLPGARLSARARGGRPGFHAIVESRRATPAQALALRLDRLGRWGRAGVSGALWRFRPGITGSRAALEVVGRLSHHDVLAAGFEEQHGVRREPATHPERFRQGAWGEWRGGPEGLALVLREELWGEGAWVRGAVRSVSAAGVEVLGPARSVLRLSHCAYRVRRGESLYLPEVESDRLVLRALTGVGERTRLELQLPLAGGVARAAAAWTAAAALPPRAQWTLDWNRRASIRRSR